MNPRNTTLCEMTATQAPTANLERKITAHLPSSILVMDTSLRVIFANQNFLIKMRKEERGVLGKRISEVFPPAILHRADLQERARTVCLTATPFEGGEIEYRAPGLAARIYFYSLTPLKDEAGRVESVMLFMDDVTEKKSLGERVREVEHHLTSVVESANDLIVSLDSVGAVMTWNSAAQRILGFTPREVTGRPFADFFTERDRPHLQALLTHLAGEGKFQEMETGMHAKGGEERLISWRFSAMRDEGGRVVALVGVGRDLTEKQHLELQLIQSAKMAALGEMAGGIAHEIRNPLAITSSAAQILLKKGNDPELLQECAEKIHLAARRAAAIIETLLRFARPSEGLSEQVDVNSAVDETLSLIGHQISLQSIEIDKQLSPRLQKVKGNKNQLQQIFMNIIMNAYYAMPEGGRLAIATSVTPSAEWQMRKNELPGFARHLADSPQTAIANRQWVEVRFTDSGNGIPEQHLPRIFDPFFTTMPAGQGTGLGLSIAYSIVKQHGGSIQVESRIGQGSTFTVTLPTERPDA